MGFWRERGVRRLQVWVCLVGLGLGLASMGAGVTAPWVDLPFAVVVLVVGVPLAVDVVQALLRRETGVDLLAIVTMATAAALGEWLVGAIIALMLSGGEALEDAATRRASSVLSALASRAPTVAHLLRGQDINAGTDDVAAEEVAVGSLVAVLPQELCPIDGEVTHGHGSMDESFLTGEPYEISKGPGSAVLSGAVNGSSALTIRATKRARDSRYAQISAVLYQAEQQRPPMRRIADRLGTWYTILAVGLAILAWAVSGEAERFLAVMVIATPCPLLIGVPVAIIGAIAVAARNGIIIKSPAMLEQVSRCRTVLFDKTGTLTYGRPELTAILPTGSLDADHLLSYAAALEGYSRHPLSSAVRAAAEARGVTKPPVSNVEEHPGAGLRGTLRGHWVTITSRRVAGSVDADTVLPERAAGLECVILVDDTVAGLIRFRDTPRSDARSFVRHLRPRHAVTRTVIISGDAASEVTYLGDHVGVDAVHAGISPEGKLAIVREETLRAQTIFLGDGINDAPAMTAATVGVAFGSGSDITAEAADAVILDSSLERVDELLHIGERLRRIALQTSIGGIGLSLIGMGFAAAGLLPPVVGAVAQEVIDVLAVLNAARVAAVRHPLADVSRWHEAVVSVTAPSA
jgi:heavy metal translocating P-type ATPase